MSGVLVLDRIRKTYQSVTAVEDLSLTLASGEFVTLLGPSGCGKSTTLRMIGGFEDPDSGRVLIQGRDVTDLPPHKRDVNVVFQDYALFPHLTVRRNISFGLELKGLGRAAIAARVDEMLALVKLEALAERMPAALSGGQKQRVALARALAPNPPILLLDEPLSALDAKLRKEMQIELRRLQRETGKTFILVTHDQEEALTMSDTVVVMNDGRIEQIGKPWDLYNRPGSEFVARFVGEMNFFPVRAGAATAEAIELDWFGTPLAARLPARLPPPGQEVLLGVRPEHIALGLDPPAAGLPNAVAGRVTERIFRGADVNYLVEANGRAFSVAAPQRTVPDGVSDVWLTWAPENALILH